ncbi:hypothetical protein AX16_010784 [Volvariella volvacea WC 439]|nr:hypothetical protein AX16_010784 [Volvariella volvacea WC 439]
MILGISWEGEMVGFDTSVFWEGKERYIRVTMPETMDEAAGANEGRSEVGSDSESGPSRRITRSASNKGKTQASQKQVERVFKIRNNAPSFLRRSICGRGTTCWVVEDNGEVYLMKDAWRYVNRDPETIWLDIVREKGCRGVAKMITYEHGALISELRRMSSDDFADDFYDRRWCRIILHAYGHDISHFKGLAQLLGALRDAISGHKELWDAGILHRDISSNNILLGADDAQPGERGILIDFDLAISTFRRDSLAAVDFRTGTRRFQALHLLMVPEDTLPRERGTITESSIYDDINNYDDLSDTEETKENRPSHPAHCHLDDLESFYYVLAWICLTFDGPGKKKAAEGQLPSLREWDDLDRGSAFKAKRDFLSAEFPMEYLSDYFKPLRKLLRILHDLTYTRFRQTRFEATPDKPVATLYQDVDMAYAMLLKAYDVALSKLPPETKLQPPPLAPEQETPPPKSPLSASASRPAPSRAYGGSASIATFSRKRRTGFSDDEETIESVGELAEEQPKHKRPRSSSLVPLPHSDVTQLTHNRNKSA